jgi:hypothetical protein
MSVYTARCVAQLDLIVRGRFVKLCVNLALTHPPTRSNIGYTLHSFVRSVVRMCVRHPAVSPTNLTHLRVTVRRASVLSFDEFGGNSAARIWLRVEIEVVARVAEMHAGR